MEARFHARFLSVFARGSGVAAVCRVVDVQQLVGAALEQIVVDIAQIGVLLRDAQRARLVRLEDGLGALGLALVAGGGLTAAADAAVRAGHDLDEVELLLAGLDLGDELISIGQAIRHRDADGQVAGRDGERLDALEPAHAALGNGLQGVRAGIVEHASRRRSRRR